MHVVQTERLPAPAAKRTGASDFQFSSENFVAALINRRTEMVSVLDSAGRFLFVNGLFCERHNISEDQIIGTSLADHVGHEHYENVARPRLEQAFSGVSSHSRNYVTPKYFDEPVYVEVEYIPFPDGAGNIVGVVLCVRDISDQRLAEHAYLESNRRLQQIAESTSDWLWETDSDHCITWISSGGQDVFNGSIAGGAENPWTQALENNAEVEEPYLCEMKIGKPFRDVEVCVDSINGKRWISSSGVPIYDENGGFTGYRCASRDVTELRATQINLAEAEQRFLQAIDGFHCSFALFDEHDRIIAYNQRYKEMHGFLADRLDECLTFEECLRIQLEKGIIAPEDPEEFIRKRLELFRNPEGPFEIEKSNDQWFRVTEQRLDDGGCLKIMVDISEIKAAEFALRESERRFRDFAEIAADWFWEMDADLNVSYLSESFESLTGIESDRVLGQHYRKTLAWKALGSNRKTFIERLENHASFSGIDLEYTDASGTLQYFSLAGQPHFSDTGEFKGFRGTGRNVTQSMRLSHQLNHQARHDELTGLVNRREFSGQLSEQLDAAIDGPRPHSGVLGFVDLDQFKIVNDTLGHGAGDDLLKQVAAIFLENIRPGDTLARLGGDEFGLIFRDVDIDGGHEIASRLVGALNRYRFSVRDKVFDLSASVGLVEITSDVTHINELMSRADIACYAAKDLGRNRIHIHRPEDEVVTRTNTDLVQAANIKDALDADRFELYIQPIVCLDHYDVDSPHDVYHNEVLLRMLSEDGDVIMPGQFIPAAERYQLMSRIDRWVIRNALATFGTRDAISPNQKMTINLSGQSLSEDKMFRFIGEQLSINRVNPSAVCFEITETAVISNMHLADKFIQQIRGLGCSIALDDFGSGLSSFNYLKNFPVDYLKIDGSFVKDIVDNPTDRTMVASMNQMAHALGIKTIAEFVETSEIAEVLKELGVEYAQGYGIGRPRPLSSKPD